MSINGTTLGEDSDPPLFPPTSIPIFVHSLSRLPRGPAATRCRIAPVSSAGCEVPRREPGAIRLI
jgi:hypothetical protein